MKPRGRSRISSQERRHAALHEAGHAVVAAVLGREFSDVLVFRWPVFGAIAGELVGDPPNPPTAGGARARGGDLLRWRRG